MGTVTTRQPEDITALIASLNTQIDHDEAITGEGPWNALRQLITIALENAAETDNERGDGHDAAEIAAGKCGDHGLKAALRNLAPLTAIWGEASWGR